MIRRLTTAVLVLALSVFGETDGELRFQWLLEDVLEEEYLPLFAAEVVGPQQVRDALDAYHRGECGTALYYLERLQELRLPDGDIDFVMFVVAECYRMLGLRKQAIDNYHYIVEHFPDGDKVAPSLFRAIEYAYGDGDVERADSLFTVFHEKYRTHPLVTAVHYVMGKVYYRSERFSEAAAILEAIPRSSSRYAQAQFLAALCRCENSEWEKALYQLEYVRGQANDAELVNEATILIADIYSLQGNHETALQFYDAVPGTAQRHEYVAVKKVQTLLALERLTDARDLAARFVRQNPDSDYYFEMASILEQTYDRLGERVNKLKISGQVFQELLDFRLSFEVMDELDRVAEAIRGWGALSDRRPDDEAAMREAQENIRKLQALEHRLKAYLHELGVEEVRRTDDPAGFTAERRYLNMIRDSVGVFTDSVRQMQGELERVRALAGDTTDSASARMLADAQSELDSVVAARRKYQQEYDLILSECFGDRLDQQRRAEDARQAQFVDWSFRKYQEKKTELVELNMRISELQQSAADSSAPKSDNTKLEFARAALTKLTAAIESDRQRLANLIASLVDMNPGGMYNPELLMRLAELHYDEGTDKFAAKLQEYERKMSEGVAEEELTFPDMNLDDAIKVYSRIVNEYPKSEVADAALFYKALAQRKVGKEEMANETMIALIEKYPQSPYFVEANMNIGRYYFEHPTIQDNQGYTLAEEAFRRVLYYRDHPQFVQALYHLGWCYYMQDQYEEAIAVFRYLVEEVDLDFDQAAKEEKQVSNPLLREEAIDYIAIAFDERGDVQEAIRFLRLIGSFDYSSVVLKRMGELREEVHDVETALEIYEFLEAEYPVTIAAPDASLNVIKIYEETNRIDKALEERESFLKRFARGSQWQQRYADTDPATAQRVDSLAVAIGMYVGDAYYRRGNETSDSLHFESAARNYFEVVKRYPDSPQAADARWNLAVILHNKLGQEKVAFKHYIEYSKLDGADSKRREQAALNAVAIAQGQIPEDSAAAEEAFTVATGKLLEAVDNYTKNFPDGESRATVMLAQASVFFNRRMFGNAAKIYEDVVALGDTGRSHYEALFHLGQCRYEQEKWETAAGHFKAVLDGSPEPQQRVAAKKLLLQSKYLAAKKLIAAQQYEQGAQALLAIEQSYPGSEQSDIVLFNAAEAYEKREKWGEASEVYYRLVENYSTSKYAPDALFNAATNFEKINDYRRASEAYEKLVNQYPDSRKAKDGLFNLGFCYEKLEEPDKMAQAQERYARLYPEEKDVEAMMIRSANYYLKAGRPEKALAVYRTYTVRFPRNDRCVEAVFKMGRAYEQMNDEHNARLQYLEAQKLDRKFIEAGSAGNSYYAAEAAYYLARMQEKVFDAVELVLPKKVLKQRQQKKASLLTEVAAAYQRVIEYQSERMFEAAYRIGELYDKLTQSWLDQEREKLDPIQQAVFDKDLYMLASALIQKSLIPYRKTIELAEGFDSLGMEQKHWVGKATENLQKNYLRGGEYLVKAVGSMASAPVPKKIREKPVYFFQYQKQLYETLEPMKKQARDYYLNAYYELKELKLQGDAVDQCANNFMRINYRIGADYQELANTILAKTADLPKNLDEIEREEIVFQLEDIVFELQDKAIFALEDAKQLAVDRDLDRGNWFEQILKSLAKLDPDAYGEQFFANIEVTSDGEWPIRPDSVSGWNGYDVPTDGWHRPKEVKRARKGTFAFGRPALICRSDSAAGSFYMRKRVFLNGSPRGGAVYVSATGPYELYVNGTLTLSDTLGDRTPAQVDSVPGIVSLLRGGDNIIACRAVAKDTVLTGIAVAFGAMIDTSKHFEPSAVAVELPAEGEGAEPRAAESGQPVSPQDSPGTQPADQGESVRVSKPATQNARQVSAGIERAERRRAKVDEQIKEENLQIQKLQVMINAADVQIKMLRKEIAQLQEQLE